MRVVNPSDTDFTKYSPESMRTEEQNAALIKKNEERSSRSTMPDYASLDVEEINANEITPLNDITEKLRETAHLLKGVGRLDEAAASEARPGNGSLNRDYYITDREESQEISERKSRSFTPEQRKLLDAERRVERLKEDNEFLRRLMESGKVTGRERGRGEDKPLQSSRIRTFPCGCGCSSDHRYSGMTPRLSNFFRIS